MILRRMRLVAALCFFIPFLTAQAQWSSNPALNNKICQAGNNQSAPRLISDGRGGAIICWTDERMQQNSFDIYAQRIDKDGFVRWTVNGVVVSDATFSQSGPDITSDDMGGAIIAWTDTRNGDNDIYAQRIDSTGKVLWSTNGVAITADTSNQADPKVTGDGKHGAIVTWSGNLGGFPPASKIYAQRIDASGNLRWGAQVNVSGNLRFSNAPSIASDGNGGAIIAYAYFDRPVYDVYAQRVDSNGTIAWKAPGAAIATSSGTQDSPTIVADGNGNAFLAYLDWGSGATANVHLVVLKRDGTISSAFRATSTSGGQARPFLANLGNGQCGAAWEDNRTAGKSQVFAQIFDTTGAILLAANGVKVSTRTMDQFAPSILGDGAGGVIVAWEDKKSSFESDIYAQRISGAGAPVWQGAGVAICTAANLQQFPRMISDGQNGAIMTWEDYRPSLTNAEIYAARILADGSFPLSPPILTFSTKSLAFGTVGIGYSSTKTITLSNTGGAEITLGAITSTDPQITVTTDNTTIAPGGNVTASVKFSPTSKNTINARIVVMSNSVFAPDTVTATGKGSGDPAILTDKMSLSFGDVKVGASKALVLNISNPGNDTLTISNMTSNNPRFVAAITSRVLLPGQAFDDTVRFTPTAVGSVQGNLTITSNAPTSPTVIPLSGTGVPEVTMTINLAAIDFGEVTVGAFKDTTVTVTNTGNDSLRISSFVSGDARFTLQTPLASIAPAGVKSFTLRFTPDAAGPHASVFTVTSNAVGSPHSIAVNGTGKGGAAITFAPPALQFGDVELGKDKDLVLTFNNPGGETLTVTSVISSNTEFSIPNTPFDVTAGSSHDASVRFAPSALGDRTGVLVITSNAPTSPDTVALQGTGIDVNAVRPLQAFPGAFTLYGNYPNPFRPSTTIRYDLETAAPVLVTVYDALGQVAATLVDEPQSPGKYSVEWTPAGTAPGVYFYLLRVGTQAAYGTMVRTK